MKKIKLLTALLITTIAFACTNETEKTESEVSEKIENPTNRVRLSSEIEWEKLNPARGDQSPQAGTVWGNRKTTVSTGFLAKFVDGFSSPPHIHNVTYRAVVIKGLVHNDDQRAGYMWMPTGSFWTQPKGEPHITAALGDENIAYVEIDKGPYLVKPMNEAFETKERPVNIDASNVVWLNSEKSNWIDANSLAEISFLWESNDAKGLRGLFVKLPANFKGEIRSKGKIFHAIIVQGNIDYQMPNDGKVIALDPASYFGSTGKAIHQIANTEKEESVIYIRTDGTIQLK